MSPGEEQGKTLRRRWEQSYVFGRRADNERPINRIDGSRPGDGVVTYQRAGWAFWMLRSVMGEEAMLAGLQEFIARWRNGVETADGLDFPLIEDLLESLRPHAPDLAAFDAYVGRWILGKDLPDLEVREAKVEKTAAGYRVTGILANIGTGRAAVKVRVEGKKPEEKEAKRAGSEATVEVTAETPGSIDLVTDFPPSGSSSIPTSSCSSQGAAGRDGTRGPLIAPHWRAAGREGRGARGDGPGERGIEPLNRPRDPLIDHRVVMIAAGHLKVINLLARRAPSPHSVKGLASVGVIGLEIGFH